MLTCIRWILPLAVLLAIASYLDEGESISAPPEAAQTSPQPLPKPGEGSTWNAPETPQPSTAPPISRQGTKVESFETALTSTTEFWSERISGYIQPRLEIYSGDVQSACMDGDNSRSYAFYCPMDETVYINQSFISEMPSQGGLYEVIGHEVAHHVQYITGTHAGHVTDDHTRHSEDEADCFAGAWAGWVLENGNAPGPDWISEINTKWQHYQWVYEYGERSGTLRRTHSEPNVRQQIFMKGVQSGLSSCGSPLF